MKKEYCCIRCGEFYNIVFVHQSTKLDEIAPRYKVVCSKCGLTWPPLGERLDRLEAALINMETFYLGEAGPYKSYNQKEENEKMDTIDYRIVTSRDMNILEREGVNAAISAARISDDRHKPVGAAVRAEYSEVLTVGTNMFATSELRCRDEGKKDREFLRKNIVHAEIAAIDNWRRAYPVGVNPYIIFITHNPCLTCTNYALFVGIRKFYIGPGQTTQGNADADMVEEIIKVSGGEIFRWQ